MGEGDTEDMKVPCLPGSFSPLLSDGDGAYRGALLFLTARLLLGCGLHPQGGTDWFPLFSTSPGMGMCPNFGSGDMKGVCWALPKVARLLRESSRRISLYSTPGYWHGRMQCQEPLEPSFRKMKPTVETAEGRERKKPSPLLIAWAWSLFCEWRWYLITESFWALSSWYLQLKGSCYKRWHLSLNGGKKNPNLYAGQNTNSIIAKSRG